MTRTSKSLRPLMLFAAMAVLFSGGCHKKRNAVDLSAPDTTTAPTVQAAAPTATLAADPLAIDLGQSVVLNWRTTNATSVTIDGIGPVNLNGTQTVSPANSTNFHLVAKGDGGTAEANARVTVKVAAPPLPTGTGDANAGAGDMGTEQAFHQNVQDVFFDYDSFDLRPDAQASAAQAASYLAAHPAIKVLIGGYCDERGSAEYNLALGENRANAARSALIGAGVAGSRVRVISYGKEKQFCTEENETCWQQNRRAQFTMDK